MGRLHILVLLAAAGCGRVDFDAVAAGSETRPDGARSSDASAGDASAGDAPVTSPVALAQKGPVVAVTTNLVLTLPAPSTPGTLLVAAIVTNGVNGVGIPAGWTVVAQQGSNGGCTVVIAIQPNNPGGITTDTFTQIAGTPGAGQLTEWSAVATSSPLDATGTTVGQNPVKAQPVQTSAATTTPGDLGVTVFCEDVTSPTYTPASGWTNLGGYSNTASSPSFTSDYALALPVAVTAETVTSSVQGKYAGAIATFHPQ